MIFRETELAGAFVIETDLHEDERGSFARTFCRQAFLERGLDPRVEQCSLSSSRRRGTLRGLHFQVPPRAEAKVVRCVRGSVYDVMVDLRPDSPTFATWVGATLSAANGRSFYIPAGFAHGFITLEDDTVLHYQISEAYDPSLVRGVRYDDPVLAIAWPIEPATVSERDRTFADLNRDELRAAMAGVP